MTRSAAPTFSFIIPVYNTATLLPRCLDSVLAQHGYAIEILLIDDGSTDDSYSICQHYAERHPFIRALTKPNEGQGVARNVGIEMARGEIVCFVDSDDFIDRSYCGQILETFRQTDAEFVNFGFTVQDEAGVVRRLVVQHGIMPESAREIFLDALLIRRVFSSPWSKAFPRKFIVDSNIRFPPVRVNEDILFACLAARAARRTAFIPSALYHMHVRPGSTSRAMTPETFRETGRMLSLAREAFADELRDPEVRLHFHAHIARVFTYLLFQGAVRMQTAEELREAFVVADASGLRDIVKYGKALQLLPKKKSDNGPFYRQARAI